jgi:hypothetical protein
MRALFLCFVLTLPSFIHAQTADDIVNNYLHFTGGEKKWKRVKSIVSKGEYDYGGVAFPFTSYSKAPNLYKFVVPFNGKYYAQGFDGTSGWKIDAFKNETKPTMLEGKAALAMANEADVEIEPAFIRYKAKGHQIKFEGIDSLDHKPFYKLTLQKKDGQIETYYFDVATYALYLNTAFAKNPELQNAILNTYFEDYRTVDGLKMPFKQTSKTGDQTVLIVTVKEVALNADLKEDDFKPY